MYIDIYTHISQLNQSTPLPVSERVKEFGQKKAHVEGREERKSVPYVSKSMALRVIKKD